MQQAANTRIKNKKNLIELEVLNKNRLQDLILSSIIKYARVILLGKKVVLEKTNFKKRKRISVTVLKKI